MRWRWKQRDFTFRSRQRRCCLSSLRGSLRSDNATATRTSLKKWICVLSVFTAIIPTTYFVKCTRRTLLKLNFKWPYSSSEREIKFRRCLFTSPLKREIRHFSRRSRAKTGKKCTKKRDARAKLLFAYKTFWFFFTFSLPSASLDLKVPDIIHHQRYHHYEYHLYHYHSSLLQLS